ncbi:MAG: hypothetical protein AYK19_03965 [Theionarchaea archaeon DG-70-1]|nr:MAG: hypothetical protein AYK19_03965 [Theionarchaea archaeon DG-70-1]
MNSKGMSSRIIAYSGIFGALAIVMTRLVVPLHFGNPNLGSTPVIVAAVVCPWPVGFIVGIIKGIGVSLWTGVWYIELPAGVGDALMAAFAYKLSKKIKAEYAVVAGQFSRYIFTSGMIALFIALMLASGGATPDITAVFTSLSQRLSESMPALAFLSENPGFFAFFAIIWIAISFPAVTLSIIANVIVAFVVVKVLGRRLSLQEYNSR